MAAEIVLLSLTQLQNFAPPPHQQQLNPSSTPGSRMWNPQQPAQEDNDESWEVRAFAEDTGNALGTTWPPRSYACTFCRREFRSAQALGGHMNVHRRDRARLHQNGSNTNTATAAVATTSSSALIIPTQELMENGGLCLLYSIPNPNPNPSFFSPTTTQMDSHSTIFPIPPYQTNNFRLGPCSINSSLCHSSNTEPSSSTCNDNNHDSTTSNKDSAIEELDLELRLGRSVCD